MQLHKLACSYMSLHAVPFFVWAAHKNFAVLVKTRWHFNCNILHFSDENRKEDVLVSPDNVAETQESRGSFISEQASIIQEPNTGGASSSSSSSKSKGTLKVHFRFRPVKVQVHYCIILYQSIPKLFLFNSTNLDQCFLFKKLDLRYYNVQLC